MEIIVGRQGCQRMQITDTTVSRKHCKLTPIGDDKYTLENLSQSGTYVDGNNILKTTVTANTIIRLGSSFSVKVEDLIPQTHPSALSTPPPSSKPDTEIPIYSIAPLKDVWNNYHDTLQKIQKEQRTTGLLRSASPIFTLGSGSISMFSRSLGLDESVMYITMAMTFIGLLLMIYSFYKSYKEDSMTLREKATEDFQNKYICPNPKCQHFVGNQPYNILRQNKNCPYCKCLFTEK